MNTTKFKVGDEIKFKSYRNAPHWEGNEIYKIQCIHEEAGRNVYYISNKEDIRTAYARRWYNNACTHGNFWPVYDDKEMTLAKTKKEQVAEILNPTTTQQPTVITPLIRRLNNFENLKNEIKTERKAQKISMQELGNRSNLSATTISRAEKHGEISLQALFKISSALGKEITLK